MRIAYGLPSLNSDGDDQEYAEGESKVAAALKEGKGDGGEAVTNTKVKRKNQKIRDKKYYICNTETGEKMVEKVGHRDETKIGGWRKHDLFIPFAENDELESISHQAKQGEEEGQ